MLTSGHAPDAGGCCFEGSPPKPGSVNFWTVCGAIWLHQMYRYLTSGSQLDLGLGKASQRHQCLYLRSAYSDHTDRVQFCTSVTSGPGTQQHLPGKHFGSTSVVVKFAVQIKVTRLDND